MSRSPTPICDPGLARRPGAAKPRRLRRGSAGAGRRGGRQFDPDRPQRKLPIYRRNGVREYLDPARAGSGNRLVRPSRGGIRTPAGRPGRRLPERGPAGPVAGRGGAGAAGDLVAVSRVAQQGLASASTPPSSADWRKRRGDKSLHELHPIRAPPAQATAFWLRPALCCRDPIPQPLRQRPPLGGFSPGSGKSLYRNPAPSRDYMYGRN